MNAIINKLVDAISFDLTDDQREQISLSTKIGSTTPDLGQPDSNPPGPLAVAYRITICGPAFKVTNGMFICRTESMGESTGSSICQHHTQTR